MRYLFLLFLICFGLNLNSQTLSVDKSDFFYQIAPIFEFKQSIVSLTFDDGYLVQFTIGLPLLKERHLPATFYVITSNVDSLTKSLIIDNLSDDYEIGSHTVTHPDLIKIGNEKATTELLNSKSSLQKWFGVNAGLTMSYPWGIYNSSIRQIVKSSYLAARSTGPGYNSLYKLERYDLKTQGFNEHTLIRSADSWIDYAIQNHLWLVEMLHGINGAGYSPINSSVLTDHLDYIKEVENNIWCTTVSGVIKYIDESKNAKVECDFCNDTVYHVRINDILDTTIYNQKLSIRIKVPTNWDNISISNNEKIKTEYLNKNKFIIFNALPDNQLITIRPGLISTPEKESGIRIVYLSANPFYDNIKFSVEVFDQSDIDITLSNLNGQLLIKQKEMSVNGVINMYFDTSGIRNGIYLLKVISSRGDCIVKKLVKI
jgi:peptidoglycan/xylan/chitin deacetylase (PgdA/CDA1 family)